MECIECRDTTGRRKRRCNGRWILSSHHSRHGQSQIPVEKLLSLPPCLFVQKCRWSHSTLSLARNHPHVPRHSHAALPPRLPSPHFARSGAIEEAAAALKRALKNVSRKKLVLRPASPRPPRSTRGRNGQGDDNTTTQTNSKGRPRRC
ncbi:hypothetical protein BLNAU_3203 [Blattamonas nauphoetae]|uniref:Uncharacterized protein n=1 Tax=Blattamonas nauphoetae TaxID=2049346 RepID=A0ABQ9YDC4_9EUKA|nr:hypothetical protein BLNAU_3203 [Blattamonas nauphoetae]